MPRGMRLIRAHVLSFRGLMVYVFDTTANCAKADEPIEQCNELN